MDSLPYFDSLADRYEEQACPNSELINKRIAQKIEQGIGRGVRGEKDYCAILIIGSELVRFMRSIATNKFFSPQTRKQIDIGIEIADMAKEDKTESPIKVVLSLIKQMLVRDEGWKEYYASEMDTIAEDNAESQVYDRLLKERQAEQFFCEGEYEKAISSMQRLIDGLNVDDTEKGWYLQQLARYTYPTSIAESIKIQKSAFKKNTQLLKPSTGIDYTKISYIHQDRLNNIRTYMRKFSDYSELFLSVNATLDNLSFGIEATKFEAALKDMYGCLQQASETVYKYCLRDVAVIELFFATGARVYEISNIRAENVNLNTGLIQLMGKGAKERYVQIGSTSVLNILRKYYAENRAAIKKSGYFFVNGRGKTY